MAEAVVDPAAEAVVRLALGGEVEGVRAASTNSTARARNPGAMAAAARAVNAGFINRRNLRCSSPSWWSTQLRHQSASAPSVTPL
ncbi:hypothetical protein ACWEV4_33945 [Streptomyces sp. NPDC003860]